MNCIQLEAFIMVAKIGSISKAAKELHLTQPALSAQIVALENDLETKLLDRSSQGVILTEAGKTFLHFAKKMTKLHICLHNDMMANNKKEESK